MIHLESEEDVFILNPNEKVQSKIFADMLLINQNKTFQLGSGATANILPRSYVPDELTEKKLTPFYLCMTNQI